MVVKPSKILLSAEKLFYVLNPKSCIKRRILKTIHTAPDGCRMWQAIVSELWCKDIVIGMILSEEYNILSESSDLGPLLI
jgi:hypothetical protein